MATKKTSKESAKKPTAAKKAAAKKPADAAKKEPAKKAAAKKPAAEPPAPAAEPAEKAAKKEYVRKPITVVKKTPKVPLKKPEAPTAFENHSQDLAFSFAERMKRRQREDEERNPGKADIKLSRRPTSRAKGEATLQFPAADLEEFRKRLILLRQEALGQSATLKTIALEQTDDRGSEDDDGSDAFMRLQNLSQVDSQNKIIQKIDEALQRIDEGTYGICDVCGQLIRKPRLLNLPFVHTCMECQTAMEKPFGSR